jgi:hypothetical protein
MGHPQVSISVTTLQMLMSALKRGHSGRIDP